MTEDRLRKLLHTDPSAAEREAEERGWAVVKAAYAERTPGRPPRSQRALILALAGAALLVALLFSPAGAQVREWIEDVVEPGEEHAAPSLTALPAPGRLLVTSEHGPWIVNEDGSKRALGPYDEATWSPNGRFVAVSRDRELVAAVADAEAVGEEIGNIRWSHGAPARVGDIAWSPSGIRVAFRTGDQVRVIAGDGTDPRVLTEQAAPVAPAWKPLSTAERDGIDPVTGIVADADNIVAYVSADRAVHVINVDSGRELWRSAPFTDGIRALEWSADGRSLLILSSTFYAVYRANGSQITKGVGIEGDTVGASFAPDSDRVALVTRVSSPQGKKSEVLIATQRGVGKPRKLYSGPGSFTDPTWSPDGATLLVGWPAADQWLFLRPGERGKAKPVANIARQFDPGGRGPAAFPRVSGWCCAP